MSEYELRPFPAARELVVDAGYLAAGRHIIYGFAEVDVTRARELLRGLEGMSQRAPTGTPLSFTAFIVACFGRAIAEHPQVQAIRDWRGRLVVFSDADIVTLVEPAPGAVAIPHIVRQANRRSVRDISEEIQNIKAHPDRSAQSGGLESLALRLPRFIRLLFFRIVKKNPRWYQQLEGTAVVTSVGMLGRGGFWGLTFLPVHTLGLTIGGIAQKPGVRDGAICIRDYLHLTIAFDHDVVDGAPAARFGRRLVELIESAALLEEADDAPT